MSNHVFSVETTRYLSNFNTDYLKTAETDVVIIGSGLSALTFADSISKYTSKVMILTKGHISNSNTYISQGGIASAFGSNDSIESHISDTLNCGRKLCNPEVVSTIIGCGKEYLKEFISEGLELDTELGTFHLAKEAGHSTSRILHKGDKTGFHLIQFLLKKLEQKNIKIIENATLIDITTSENTATSALINLEGIGPFLINCKVIVVATGSIGKIYRETTNSSGATGDGIAACFRAGALLRDMEFVQFHPTALYMAGAPRKLITEAVRGAGAKIVDENNDRFLFNYDKNGELAPRDILARAITTHMKANGLSHVYLDIKHFNDDLFHHFPELIETCRQFKIDPTKDLIPIRPAAHYFIGGVKTTMSGQTNIESLYAIGECASTGFHGANRLASNSLLECIVMGKSCAEEIGKKLPRLKVTNQQQSYNQNKQYECPDLEDMKNSLSTIMLKEVGIERQKIGLNKALKSINELKRSLNSTSHHNINLYQFKNMLTLAECITKSALTREESRGVHFRTDFQSDSDTWLKHIEVKPAT